LYTGSCLCGGVQFRLDGEPEPIQVCHCSQCRKAQGTPFATNMPARAAEFHITSGRELLKEYESSPGKVRYFCGRCGSPVYSQKNTTPDVVRLRAGTINEPLKVRPIAHFYTAYAANWWTVNDGLPKFPEAYAPKK